MGIDKEELRRKAGKSRPDELVDRMTSAQTEELRRVFETGSAADIAAYVLVNEADIRETLARQSGIYAYVAVQYREAKVAVARAKRDVERIRAETFNRRQQEEPDLTIGKTERLVDADSEVEKAEEHLLQCRAREARYRAATEALEQRKDMLQSVAAIMRTEMESY